MKRHYQNGFTLIELMIVVIIIAALAAMVAPNLIGRSDEAKAKIAQGDLASLDTALKLYRLDKGAYPTGEQGLEVLLAAPGAGREPYLDKPALDPWRRKYQYRFPGTHRPAGYDLFSAGADGKEGTEDDVKNWE
ncbi:MAG: type II secretion system major pseudopilin GspG [bacterium]